MQNWVPLLDTNAFGNDCFCLNYSWFCTSKSLVTLDPARQGLGGVPPSPFDAQASRDFSRVFSKVNSKDVYGAYLGSSYKRIRPLGWWHVSGWLFLSGPWCVMYNSMNISEMSSRWASEGKRGWADQPTRLISPIFIKNHILIMLSCLNFFFVC